MELINAKEAAKIASAARAELALIKTSIAENCVKQDIMPCIIEAADYGKNMVVVELASDNEAYRLGGLIISILIELGYDAKVGENNKGFLIKW